MSHIHSVSEITQVIKRTLENSFPYIWVKGEVTNFTRAGSGHLYFSLKDENALLPCVWYRHQQKDISFDPNTGEVFDTPLPSLAHTMEQGMEMLFAGSLNVYPPRGAYQFIIDKAEEVGKGSLHRAFEALKIKLAQKGWFDNSHKKKLPVNPKKIAVLTSPQGAVIHDFCRIARQYGLSSSLHIYPIAVQGNDAVRSIVEAFEKVHKDNWADVIVLIRGGGSLEDLWAFNEEEVARVIFEASIPVITGIGHQVDMSIADFVADVSAATPSHVVSHLWEEKEACMQYVDELEEALERNIYAYLTQKANVLTYAKRNLNLLSPEYKINMQAELLQASIRRFSLLSNFVQKKEESLLQVTKFLSNAIEQILHTKNMAIEKDKAILEAHNPYSPLEKGYALVHKLEGKKEELVKSVYDIRYAGALCLEFKDGKAHLNPQHIEIFKKGS